MKHKIENNLIKIQSDIINAFESLESENGSITSLDEWKREEGGGGKTFVIENGSFFDKCAVNFSSIKGNELPKTALANNLNKEVNYGYKAMGVSVISHPKNPNVPTSHMNVRLFGILDKNKNIKDWWIGGGYDLTPYISFSEDNISWHNSAKETLDKYNKNFYKSFSENCNKYFYIPHRKERRGIGGIFFDNLSSLSLDDSLKMLNSIASTYLNSYLDIVSKRQKIKYSSDEKDFQLIRRGRYAEFNLIYDRGTSFGLQSNGRIESILASLPTEVKWKYKKNKKYKIMERALLKNLNRDWNE